MFSSFLSKYKTTLIALVITIAIFGYGYTLYTQNRILKAELSASQQNIKALNDTIIVVKDNAGKDEANKFALIAAQSSDLKKLNDSLYIELQKTKGSVNTIEVIKTQIKHDTVTKIISIVDTTKDQVKISFKSDTVYNVGNFRNIEGNSIFDKTTGLSTTSLTKDEIGVRLITGIKGIEKGQPTIFVRSDYPGFVVTGLDGAVINPNLLKKKQTFLGRLSVGLNLSYSPLAYDLVSKNFGFKNQITFGIGTSVKLF